MKLFNIQNSKYIPVCKRLDWYPHHKIKNNVEINLQWKHCLILDIRVIGMNDNTLISNPIQALNRKLNETVINTKYTIVRK